MGDFSFTITPEPTSSRAARDEAAGWLGDHPCRERLILAVSELVSNAIRHGPPGRPIEVHMVSSGPTLRLEVGQADGAFHMPETLDMPPPDQAGGRGLPVVASLATRWGVEGGPGSHVWAEFDGRDCVEPIPTGPASGTIS